MNEERNTGIVQQAYEAFKRGDIQSVLSILSEQVEWRTPQVEGVPFGGNYHGRDDVARFFSEMVANEEVTRFEPQSFIAQGDRLVALGAFSAKVLATGRAVTSDWVHVFTLEDGKVTSFREHFDTAAVAGAFRADKAATARIPT